MATMLNVDSAVPGRQAVNAAPRLASVLMGAFHQGEPLKITAHAANANQGLATLFSPGDPLSKWVVERAQQGERAAEPGASSAAPATAVVPQASAPALPLAPISSLYRRLLGETGGISRLRSVDEEVEAERPAPAGDTADAARQNINAEVDRETELTRLAALVVGGGFGTTLGMHSDGEFEATVRRHVGLAADVIAPVKSVAGMQPAELRAIVTASIHSSTASFLEGPGRSQSGAPGIPRQLVDVAKAIPDGGKVAGQFTDKGKFNEEKFLETVGNMSMQASQVLGATPMGLKLALLGAAAQKAAVIVKQVKQGTRDKDSEGRMKLGIGKLMGARQALADQDEMQYDDSPSPHGA